MSGSFDPRWGDDPRDRYDDDRRDRDEDYRRSADARNDPRERGDRYGHELERDHGWETRDRAPDDPRDVLLDGLDLPRGLEREVVVLLMITSVAASYVPARRATRPDVIALLRDA